MGAPIVEVGEQIGDWIVGHPLGRGGMATVYNCANILSPRIRGAIKIVDTRGHAPTRARFIREVEAMSRLRHHAVIRVLTSGEDLQRGLLYLVMELIEGEDLLQILKRGRMNTDEVCTVFRDVADGLRHAHNRGIHHRDIKPANVMVTEERGGCLVDFGIALDQERSRLTRVGMVPGTVSYMAPELLTSDPRSCDPDKADVYSLGLVMFEAITGERAFPLDMAAGHAVAMIRVIERKHARGALDVGELAPANLREVVRLATEPNPLLRPGMSQIIRQLDVASGALDEPELEPTDEATMLTTSLMEENSETTFPFSLPYDPHNLSPEEEETAVMDLMSDVNQALLEAVEKELEAVGDRTPLEPVRWPEEDQTLSSRAISEDEEMAGAFSNSFVLEQIHAQTVAKRRRKMLVYGVMGVLVALAVFLSAVVGTVGTIIYLYG